MKKTIPVMLVAFMLVMIAVLQTVQIHEESVRTTGAALRHIAVNQAVPEFTLVDWDGKEYHVGGKREKPLMINFWASWCGPCHEEAPALQQVYEKYSSQFDLYAVNVTKGDRIQSAKQFAKQYGFTFPVLLDKQGKAADDYRLMFVPTSYLINKEGKLVEVLHVLSPEELEKRIQRLIAS